MEAVNNFVFQVDSPIVQNAYRDMPNYKIKIDPSGQKDLCVIYFASHYIYNPNEETAFKRDIVTKDKFEWYETTIKSAGKHLFLRDIQKQWYLTGINAHINNPDSLLAFLKTETAGFRVITVGSSAGGFAAILYGQQLGAEQIFSFNGQFEVNSQLETSSEAIDPVIFRNRQNTHLRKYYEITWAITNPEVIFYFYSINSAWDAQQASCVENKSINRIPFRTSHHGIPFLKNNLPVVLNMSPHELRVFSNKIQHPILFSVKLIGLTRTIAGLLKTLNIVLRKFFRR
jgi:hypothetical protein